LLLLVGLNPRQLGVATEAARTEFAAAQTIELPDLAAALESGPSAGNSLLVLAEPSDVDVSKATRAQDPDGLPRWGVVLIRSGSSDPEAEAVAADDWAPSLAGRVFRCCDARQRARREVASLRGDLLTVGLRIALDLRTPLGGIAVCAETLKDALSEDCPDDLPLVRPISDSCDELATMIRQVSVVAKATARPVPQERLSMGSAVWSALERLAPATKAAGASVSEPKTWPEVVGDSVSLEAVWWNLVSNAIRHAGKSPRIELGWEAHAEGLRFWVRDHGTGVAERSRKLLFQPFHRLHEPNATRGLGLPIVQRLVQLLGGQCGYEPVSTGGSLFYFTLPKAARNRG
jgi:signal transduction histidine kinase